MRIVLLLLVTLPLLAGEYAVLSTGFRLHAERHEESGDTIRLFTADGLIELPKSAIVAFEPEDYVAPPPAGESAPEMSTEALLDDAAIRYGLPKEILHSVAAVESSYRQDAVSHKGAIGVMQLMPGTAAQLNADPHDLEQNVDAGARHLRNLLIKYDGGVYRALAAYNAGAGAVQKYGGIPPYPETRNYVRRVVERYKRLSVKQSRTTDD